MDKYCVIGNPVDHSKSPLIHSLFARQTGREISYDKVTLAEHEFSSAVCELFANGLAGCNITVPFKEDAWRLCDSLSQAADIARAVNTIIPQDDNTLLGENTDGKGLVTDLQNNGIVLQGSRILLAGAGGAARGILKPLLDQNPELLIIANRTVEKAQTLADSFKTYGNIYSYRFQELDQMRFDLVINATSTSLSGDIPPIPGRCLSTGTAVYDLMYGKACAAFLDWSDASGASSVMDGLGMLVEQAAESFYLWQGIRPQTREVIQQLRKQAER